MKNPLPTILIRPKEPRVSFAQFCALHDFTVHVNERDPETRTWGKVFSAAGGKRYFASIPHLEVAEDEEHYFAPFGNGDTVRAALNDLAKQMNDKEIRIDHRFLRMPKLILK